MKLIISTKAGYLMGPGPYGEWGSRKSLLSQSGPESQTSEFRLCGYFFTPTAMIPIHLWKRTIGALDTAVRSGESPVCRNLELSCRCDCGSLANFQRPEDSLPDPSALLFNAQQMD